MYYTNNENTHGYAAPANQPGNMNFQQTWNGQQASAVQPAAAAPQYAAQTNLMAGIQAQQSFAAPAQAVPQANASAQNQQSSRKFKSFSHFYLDYAVRLKEGQIVTDESGNPAVDYVANFTAPVINVRETNTKDGRQLVVCKFPVTGCSKKLSEFFHCDIPVDSKDGETVWFTGFVNGSENNNTARRFLNFYNSRAAQNQRVLLHIRAGLKIGQDTYNGITRNEVQATVIDFEPVEGCAPATKSGSGSPQPNPGNPAVNPFVQQFVVTEDNGDELPF